MKTYSVADATNNLSDLIDRALLGEGVVITRHGTPVIEFKPVRQPRKPVTAADLAWLANRRLRPGKTPAVDAGELLSAIRDED